MNSSSGIFSLDFVYGYTCVYMQYQIFHFYVVTFGNIFPHCSGFCVILWKAYLTKAESIKDKIWLHINETTFLDQNNTSMIENVGRVKRKISPTILPASGNCHWYCIIMSWPCVLLILALVCGESLIHNMVPDLEDNTTYWLGWMDASYFLCKLECSSLDLSASKELGRAEAKAGSIGIRSLWWDL